MIEAPASHPFRLGLAHPRVSGTELQFHGTANRQLAPPVDSGFKPPCKMMADSVEVGADARCWQVLSTRCENSIRARLRLHLS